MADENRSQQKKPKKLSRLGSSAQLPAVPAKKATERVPDWLRMLLGKYGEAEGRLIGLQDDEPEDFPPAPRAAASAPPPAEESAELSALLEYMAEEGPPAAPTDRAATSVEWGAAPVDEPGSGSIDDVLAGIGAGPAAESAEADDIPDWLSEPAAPPVTGREAYVEDAGDDDLDIPDWLNDNLSPASAGELAPADLQPEPDLDDLPDWITGEVAAPPQAEELEAPADEAQEFDIPDWLSDMAPPAAGATPAAEGEAADQAATADITDWEVPDWISEAESPPVDTEETLIGSPFTDLPGADAENADIPDWLAAEQADETITAVEGPLDDSDVPDWLSSLGAVPAEETDDLVEEQELRAELEDEPDWLAEFSETPQADTTLIEPPETDENDWMSGLRATLPVDALDESETETEEVEAGADEELEIPAWLAEQPGDVEAKTEEAEEELEMPDWLQSAGPAELELEEVEVEAEEAEADEDIEMSDWLAELPDEAEAETEEAETGEDIEMPDWLVELPDEAEAETEEAETGEDIEMPDWLAELPAAEAEAGDDKPDWLKFAAPAEPELEEAEVEAEEAEADEDIEMSDWLAELPATETEEAETGEDIEMPDWLAELPAAEAEAADDKPDWLKFAGPAELEVEEAEIEADEAEIDEDIEMPDWLAELPATETEEAETGEDIEMPDWLVELPAAEAEEAGDDKPDWLRFAGPAEPELEEAESEAEESEIDEDIEMPDWLAELPAAEAETGDDKPDWLKFAGPAEPELEEAESEAEEAEADEDIEMPDWLAELPAAEAEAADDKPDWLRFAGPAEPELEEAESEAEEAEADEDIEMPDWLAELPAAEAETGDDKPDWLKFAGPAEPELEEAESEADEAEIDEDIEMPDWLAELPAAEAEETGDDKPDWLKFAGPAELELEEAEVEAEEEVEPSEWLTELPGEAEAEADEDIEMPDWLAELPAAEAEEAGDDKPDWLKFAAPAELELEEAEVEADEEIESPDWLAEMPDEAEAEATEAGEDIEMPDWLAGLRKPVAAAYDESSDWPETDTDAEEADDSADTPDWLTDSGDTDEGDPIAETEADNDIPDWLLDLPNTSPEPSRQPAAAEDDTPDWLTDLSFSTAPAAEDEEAPNWIDNLDSGDDSAAADELDFGDDDELVIPDWLGAASLDELETPAWLLEDVDDTDIFPKAKLSQPGGKAAPDWSAGERAEKPPGSPPPKPPDSAAAEDDSPKKSKGESLPEELPATVAGDSPLVTTSDTSGQRPAGPAVATSATADGGAFATRRTRRWLDTVQPTGEEMPSPGAAETTGMLGGLSTLLPAEKVVIPATETGETVDQLARAAQQFYEIATLPPQPAALPRPVSLQDKIIRRASSAVLYLIFMAVVALPLLFGWQNAEGGPLTEPSRDFSDVLDSQRRQLISEQLGIIDLQQPGAVALVSVDYSPGTQGEMQPLTEALLGRLTGQGMRLIVVSLEPEGAPLAQQTIETLLAERGESYGEQVINLGYLPGQVAAVRQLAAGEISLSARADFIDKTPLADHAGWDDVKNIGDVSVVLTLADNPATARWWIEQMQVALPPKAERRYLLAAASATAEPFLAPYRASEQLDGLITGINGAAAIEAGRRTVGPARQMIDSLSLAHLLIVILIVVGTIIGWMPPDLFGGNATESTPQPAAESS
ncbi:MAG: hypothetical protein FOGNACKC_01656 [Anaerolineae bacterium]|nr:hypothetical protein [Anaerolineae bacterium]